MDHAVGTGWRLVLKEAALQAEAAAMAADLGAELAVLALGTPDCNEAEGVLAAWFAQRQCAAALVRPDHYVYGVANDAAQLKGLLTQLRSQL